MSRSDSAKSHLLAQYQDKPIMYALIESICEEMDEIDVVINDLNTKRWIDTAEGVQLDGIGTIIDRDRIISNSVQLTFFGFEGQPNAKGFGQARFRSSEESYLSSSALSDEEYRLVLRAKIFKNSSLTYAEDTISSLLFLFDTNKIILTDVGNAKFIVAVGRILTENEIIMMRALDLFVRGGGVGCQFLSHFEYGNTFGFEGQKGAVGFGQGRFASIFL
jgi:hypothetical protein